MKKILITLISCILLFTCFTTVLAEEGDKYKLSFSTNGVQEIEDQWYEENAKIELPAGEAEGYMFIGWYANDDFSELFTLKEMPAKDTVVYGLYAVPLTKLVYEFKDINISDAVSKTGMTPEEFNKAAKENGFEIAYTVNGKHYIVDNIVNYMDEITQQVNNDIGKGKTAGMNVTIKLGQNDIGSVYTFNIYNDIVTDITTTSATEKTEAKTSDNYKNEPVPNTGSSKAIPALIVLFVLTVGITTTVTYIKKKKH